MCSQWNPSTLSEALITAAPATLSKLVVATVATLNKFTRDAASIETIWLWQLVVFKRSWL